MKSTALFTLVSTLCAVATAAPQPSSGAGAACDPKLTTTALGMGKGVPMKPEDIPKGCSDFEVLVARGTSEYSENKTLADRGGQLGKYGIVVGDPLISNVTKVLPGSRGYPVQYPADSNVIAGVRAGAADVVNRITQQSKACPKQKFALVGYSQGAAVMHIAAPKLSAELQAKVVALVMFGDPSLKTKSPFPPALEAKTLENCAVADPVCSTGSCFDPHLQYGRANWIWPTTDFIVSAFKGKPMPGKVVATEPLGASHPSA